MLVINAIVFIVSTDKMKPAMVAKLAIQCSELYADAVKLLQLESIKSLWPKVKSEPALLHMMSGEILQIVTVTTDDLRHFPL